MDQYALIVKKTITEGGYPDDYRYSVDIYKPYSSEEELIDAIKSLPSYQKNDYKAIKVTPLNVITTTTISLDNSDE